MAGGNREAAGRKELEHMPTIPHLLIRNPGGTRGGPYRGSIASITSPRSLGAVAETDGSRRTDSRMLASVARRNDQERTQCHVVMQAVWRFEPQRQ